MEACRGFPAEVSWKRKCFGGTCLAKLVLRGVGKGCFKTRWEFREENRLFTANILAADCKWCSCCDKVCGVSAARLLLQGVGQGGQRDVTGQVRGEGKQSWHKTTRRCRILTLSLHRAELLLGRTGCSLLTRCWGQSRSEIPYSGAGSPMFLFFSCLHTIIPLYQVDTPSQDVPP